MALNFKNIKNASISQRNLNEVKQSNEKIPFEHIFKIKIQKPKISENLSLLLGQKIDVNRLCFFDTETTGLSGGAGTVIFLAGIGYFEDEGFIVKQFFIDKPGKEVILIENLKEIMKTKNEIVTYNGKSFDMPLLNTRTIMNRVSEIKYLKQIDLLHVSRFIWKEYLINCKLSTIETQILKMRRIGDIPGQFIPAAYREFILRGETSQIKKIIYHNREDIVSLARILEFLGENAINLKNYFINMAISRKLYLINHYEQSLSILRKTLDLLEIPTINQKKDIFKSAAVCLKRQKKFDEAAKLWSFLKTEESYFELVMYYEHKKKDYMKAKELCLFLINKKNTRIKKDNLIYRLSRLNRKLEQSTI